MNQVHVSGSYTGLTLDITHAWYADGQGDGKQNDAFAVVTFNIDNGLSKNILRYNITITLPSGVYHTYSVKLNTSQTNFEIQNNFWNHATESGWYSVSITASLNYNCHTVSDTLTFDPPGGDNADPISFSIST